MGWKADRRKNAIKDLLEEEQVKVGDVIYTSLVSVSRSGMSRRIRLFHMRNNIPVDITLEAGRVLGLTEKGEGIRVDGCGMDMGFFLVYSLSSRLWPNGHECIGEECPSNAHSNGDRDYTPHHHRDGGYALKHIWL